MDILKFYQIFALFRYSGYFIATILELFERTLIFIII